MNGERGNYRGTLFHDRAATLVRWLGYKELFSKKWGVDFIAEPPPGFPASNPHRPLFSPTGTTAFEFTCDADVGDALVEELTGKVQAIAKDQGVPTVGGVIACDIRIADRLTQSAERNSVYIWDVRDLTFLTHKVHDLNVSHRFSDERVVDSDVTYLWNLVARRRAYAKAQIAILFHHPLHEISLAEFRKVMSKVDDSVTGRLREVGLLPAQVETEIRCRGYYSEDLTKAQDVLDELYKEEKAVYSLTRLNGSDVAPWSGFNPVSD